MKARRPSSNWPRSTTHRDINRKTAFIAIAGFGESATITTRVFNTAFKALDLNVRCLPIEIGDLNQVAEDAQCLEDQSDPRLWAGRQ